MKRLRVPVAIAVSLVIIMGAVAGALASTNLDTLPACTGENVSGVVVAVDSSTGTVTIDTGGGVLCTVTLTGTYDHPIVELLGQYFGEISVADLEQALLDLSVCVLPVGDGTYTWADCSAPGAVPAVVISSNGDGTYVVQLGDTTTTTTTIAIGGEAAATVDAALAALAVSWSIFEGDLQQVSDQIAAYHDMGIGFGVLVKLYAMAEAAGVPVQQLVDEFLAGNGLGILIKSYSRPELMGVGHVRKALQDAEETGDDPADDGEQPGNGNGQDKDKKDKKDKEDKVNGNDKPKVKDDKTNKGICNAKDKGGKPKNDTTCP